MNVSGIGEAFRAASGAVVSTDALVFAHSPSFFYFLISFSPYLNWKPYFKLPIIDLLLGFQ